MSLVGSLEDLGIGDILQIVSLSRKSGMLLLHSDSGDGRIVLRNGLIQGAAIKGEVEDLRGLLISAGCVDADSFERARRAAGDEVSDLDAALIRECGLESERLASLRREHVERSVMRMFGWRTGEFTFEIREQLSNEDRELLLSQGLNTQYLAMEATRLDDEDRHASGGAGARGEPDLADDDEMIFSGEAGKEDDPQHALALATAHNADAAPAQEAEPAGEVAIDAPPIGDTEVPVAIGAESQSAEPEPEASSGFLVAIDANLSSLEWFKASVDGLFRHVHIFQRREAGLERIRQYLVRGIVPIVVLADAPADRRGADAQSFLPRLRGLAPTMPILALRSENVREPLSSEVDGGLQRPASPSADPDRWHLYESTAEALRGDLEPWLRGEGAATARRRAGGVLARLKRVSERLRDPSAQGEVLSLVLDYGAELFARVALFMVREDGVVGIAQRGLPDTGGPDADGIRAVRFAPEAMPDLFGPVLSERVPVCGALFGDRDHTLAERLGAAIPSRAYAAPIESGGHVVAIVYADNLPDEKALADTTAFEIVLHEAGLVLDRAVLERALAEKG